MSFCSLCTFRSDSQKIIEKWGLIYKHLVHNYSGKKIDHIISIDVEMLYEGFNRGVKIPEKLLTKIHFIHEYSAESNLSTFSTKSIQELLENVLILLKNGDRKKFLSSFDDLLSNETSPVVDKKYKPIFADPTFKEFLDLLRLEKNQDLIVSVDSDAYLKGLLEEPEENFGKEDLVVRKPYYF